MYFAAYSCPYGRGGKGLLIQYAPAHEQSADFSSEKRREIRNELSSLGFTDLVIFGS